MSRRTRQSIMDAINDYSFKIGEHTERCISLVHECVIENAEESGEWTYADKSNLMVWDSVWGTLVADLIEQYLDDGSASCHCD